MNVMDRVNGYLKEIPPVVLIAGTLAAVKMSEGAFRGKIGDLALLIPAVRRLYEAKQEVELAGFCEKTRKGWEKFGILITRIPEKGWSDHALLTKLHEYQLATEKGLLGKQFSGTIYPHGELSERLKTIYTKAFETAYLWNSLHGEEFGIGAFLEYQVVQMVADLFGGVPGEVVGFVTSGGTESLMTAMRAYRDLAGHKPGEGVIIASKTVHAGILKAAIAYSIKMHLVDTDEQGNLDLEALQEAADQHKGKVIALVGSSPAYPYGNIDPIEKMSLIAEKIGCGLHVDCCLGAFIDNPPYLKLAGVTSLSADTHKNGWAPKGSSVLVTRPHVAKHSIYALPDWSGGVYGTPKDAGSQSCVPALTALLAMLAIGKSGYREIAVEIHQRALNLAKRLKKFQGKILLIRKPDVNVVAFKIDPTWGLAKGATYAFAHEMAKEGFIFNTLKGDAAHFCVTARFLATPLDVFEAAIKKSLEALGKPGYQFSGDAGMYCALDAALHPSPKSLSIVKYVENLLLGQKGAHDAVRNYFLAKLNPYQALTNPSS